MVPNASTAATVSTTWPTSISGSASTAITSSSTSSPFDRTRVAGSKADATLLHRIERVTHSSTEATEREDVPTWPAGRGSEGSGMRYLIIGAGVVALAAGVSAQEKD